MLNQQKGPYKIISKLGEGGMAIVYLAEKGTLGKKVALKVLKDEFLLNRHVRGRFLSEARKMISLNHPNIVGVHDLIDNTDFVAIELDYIEGKTLKQHLQEKGALPDDEIEHLFKQMLDAVGHLHEKGFIHRDIKPSNFMLSENGIIKLTDFGIAKNVDDSNVDYTGTGTGMQMGTPKYMSPEQVLSTKDVDYRSDIYSLGVVLWEMVTGRVPYDIKTESIYGIFKKIEAEPLEKTNTKWDTVIRKATQKRADDRYANVGDIVWGKEKPPVPDNSKKRILYALGVVLFLVIAVVVFQFIKTSLPKKEENTTARLERNNKTGTFEDSRDGTTYKWVKIGNQTWMAENLAYKSTSGNYWAYDNDFSNVSKYGYLYDWKTACNDCPSGWHLPSDTEWKELEIALGMSSSNANSTGLRGTNEGDALKSSSNWNGNNSSGFTALPGGFGLAGSFSSEGSLGYWWSATESGSAAWRRLLLVGQSAVYRYTSDKGNGYSVRCVRN